MKSTRLLSIPVYFLFGIALLISAGCEKTPGSPASVTYTISFNANGGFGVLPAAITFTHKQGNLTAPEKPADLSATAGQDFAGWNTKRNGSGTDYAVGASLDTLTEGKQNTILYAKWESWVVSTFAGGSSTSNPEKGTTNGIGTAARFNLPHGIALDKDGNIYVADGGSDRIRKITKEGVVSTLASGGFQFSYPEDVALDKDGNIYVADTSNNRILKITIAADGSATVSTLVSTNRREFSRPSGVAVYSPDVSDRSKDIIYVADRNNNRIRKITTGGGVSTLASGFNQPRGVAVDSSGNIYVADSGNNRIQKITIAADGSATVSTIAGGTEGYMDGFGTAARFNSPHSVAVDKDGNIYVADSGNNRIRKITPAGKVSTIAGGRGRDTTNGIGTEARFSYPHGVVLDKDGNIYVADTSNNRIRKMELQVGSI